MPYTGNRALAGLHPVRNSIGGNAPHIGYYDVSASYATSIGEGCVVVKTSTGLQLGSATAPTAGTIVGVAAGNMLASTGGKLPVWDDPHQEFEIICSAALSAAETISAIGRYSNLTANAYSSTTKQSDATLDKANITGTAAAGVFLQIIRLGTAVGDDYASANMPLVVRFTGPSHIYGDTSVNHP